MTTPILSAARRVRWTVTSGLGLVAALSLVAAGVSAQSPVPLPTAGPSAPSTTAGPTVPSSPVVASSTTAGPSAPSSPSASLRPDCAWLAGLLPAARDAASLTYGVKHGAQTVTPSDVLDPLLAVLGVQLDDLCQVVFWYGDPDASRPQLLQFQGADPAVLPDALAGFFVKLYASYEKTLVDGSATIAGRTVRTLTDTGSPGQVFYIYPLGDALLLTDDKEMLAFVLPGLPLPGDPMPQVTAPPTPAASPLASPPS